MQRTSLLINGVYLYSLVLYTWSVFASQWYVHLLTGVLHKNWTRLRHFYCDSFKEYAHVCLDWRSRACNNNLGSIWYEPCSVRTNFPQFNNYRGIIRSALEELCSTRTIKKYKKCCCCCWLIIVDDYYCQKSKKKYLVIVVFIFYELNIIYILKTLL